MIVRVRLCRPERHAASHADLFSNAFTYASTQEYDVSSCHQHPDAGEIAIISPAYFSGYDIYCHPYSIIFVNNSVGLDDTGDGMTKRQAKANGLILEK